MSFNYGKRNLSHRSDFQGFKMLRQQEAMESMHREIAKRVSQLFEERHEYPIWPHFGVPEDAYEREMFEPIRHTYYQNTIFLIHLLRILRKVK